METILEHAAGEVPGLAVLVVVVWMFLKDRHDFLGTIKDMNQENLQAREHSRIIIEANSRAVGENTSMLHAMTQALTEFRKGTR